MQLLAADRSVTPRLALEVHLFAIDERPEHDRVTGVAKRVEAREVREENVGVVVAREPWLDRRAAALLGIAREDVLGAVTGRHEAHPGQPRHLAHEVLMGGYQLSMAHPLGALDEVHMGGPAR